MDSHSPAKYNFSPLALLPDGTPQIEENREDLKR